MLSRIGIAFVWIVLSAQPVRGQSHAEVDSLIDAFLVHGLSSSWTPSRLFAGCRRMEPWQEYAFGRLVSMELTAREEKDLATAWVAPMHHCDDPRLDQWFMDRFDAAIRRGDWREKLTLRTGFRMANRPRIQQYLRNLATDPSPPQGPRGWALGLYFERLSTDEKLALFLEVFQAPERFPIHTGVATAQAMLERDPQGLMRSVGDLLRSSPALADQEAFAPFVQSSYRYTDLDSRRALADALEEGLARTPGLTVDQRGRLKGSVWRLRQPRR